MYQIRHAGAKGLGVFAKHGLARGTRVIAERPVLAVKNEREVFAAAERLAAQDRSDLSQFSINEAKRSSGFDWAAAAWHQLRNGSIPRRSTTTESLNTLDVFRNNNFDIGNHTQAMFQDISRINHTCVPNCQGNFNSAIGQFTIHAIRPIDADEEVTISYLDEHAATRESRQSRLHNGYGFHCNCPICHDDTQVGRESEERRRRMQDKLKEYAEKASASETPDHQVELDGLRYLINFFEDEGLAGRELATM